MNASVLFVAMQLVLGDASAQSPDKEFRAEPVVPLNPTTPAQKETVRSLATERLHYLYIMHMAIRGCTELSQQLGRQDYGPSVTLDESRRALKAADEAAKEIGIDIDLAWRNTAPSAVFTGEALKSDTPEHLDKCQRTGRLFRLTISDFQAAINALGSNRTVIEKDY